jgi:hypothetical protein
MVIDSGSGRGCLMANERLADLARERAGRYPPRTPERRAAAALYVALDTTKTPDAARRALEFADKATRTDALALLRILERETTGAVSAERA